MSYKWCMVSTCKNTSIKTPKKLFVRVPDVATTRNKWFQLAHRNPDDISPKSVVFFCEDHFHLEMDMENYVRYKVMGSVKRIKLKPNAMPSKFNFDGEKKCKSKKNNTRAKEKLQNKHDSMTSCSQGCDHRSCPSPNSLLNKESCKEFGEEQVIEICKEYGEGQFKETCKEFGEGQFKETYKEFGEEQVIETCKEFGEEQVIENCKEYGEGQFKETCKEFGEGQFKETYKEFGEEQVIETCKEFGEGHERITQETAESNNEHVENKKSEEIEDNPVLKEKEPAANEEFSEKEKRSMVIEEKCNVDIHIEVKIEAVDEIKEEVVEMEELDCEDVLIIEDPINGKTNT